MDEHKISTHEHILDQHERRLRAHGKEIDTLKELAVRHQADAIHRDEMIKRMDAKLDELLLKPADRWDTVTKNIILIIITAVITYILSQAGIK